jgi:tetratricopeptide (TPR) repeat protein
MELAEGTPQDCIADLTIAIRLRPENALVWSNRALAYLAYGEYRQAIADGTHAIELGDKRNGVLLTRGAAYAYLGEFEKSLADYNRAIELVPSDARGFIQRSAVYAAMDRNEEAEADWQKAISLSGKDLQVRDRPSFASPRKPAERKQLTNEEEAAVAAAILRAQKAGDEFRLDDCIKAADEALRIDPTCAPAHSLRARALSGEAALAAANEALRFDPENAWAYFARGKARFELQNDLVSIIADTTITIRLDPANADAWHNRGYAYGQRGQFHQALADLNEAVRLRPQRFNYANRGMCLLCLGEYEKALADYIIAAKIEPTNPQWRRVCAAIYARLENFEESRKQQQMAAQIDPRVADMPLPALPAPLPSLKQDPELALQ